MNEGCEHIHAGDNDNNSIVMGTDGRFNNGQSGLL